MSSLSCRLCGTALRHTFVDLGMAPLANSFLKEEALGRMEPFYPLHPRVCEVCLLIQLPEFRPPAEIFGDYAYFSSYSDTWLAHTETYARRMTEQLGLRPDSLVVEIASNDGYLLRNFRDRSIHVLGIEPARNVAEVANAAGIPTLVRFFGVQTARDLAAEGRRADLLVGNNVLAHVPDLHDFVEGLRILLAPGGLLTMEFPHLLRLIENSEFDTIYHEHFSYLSLRVVRRLFDEHGLTIVDVEEITSHGGSLRIHARHAAASPRVDERVAALALSEEEAGLGRLETYLTFRQKAAEVKNRLLAFLIEAKTSGKNVAAYGAPAKGNTLLNYCGIRTDYIDYAVDRSPHKQGLYLPGTHIPIHPPSRVDETQPDYLLILPWNLRDEIAGQMSRISGWGARFVVPIPRLEVFE